MTAFKVGYFVGSLARGSINRKLAKALVKWGRISSAADMEGQT